MTPRRRECRKRTNTFSRAVGRHPSYRTLHERRAHSDKSRGASYFTVDISNLRRLRTPGTRTWHGARTVDQRADAQSLIKLDIIDFLETRKC
jgi:hypothetical protein